MAQIATSSKSIIEQYRSKNTYYIKQKLGTKFLSTLASYVISDNLTIRTKGYRNMQLLLDMINRKQYTTPEDQNLLTFIERGLYARLMIKLDEKEDVIDYITSHGADTQLLQNINPTDISNNTVEYINDQVSSFLNGVEFDKQIDKFVSIKDRYDRCSTAFEKEKLQNEWSDLIRSTNNSIRMNKIEKKEDEPLFISDMEDYARESYKELTSNRCKLQTGITYLNYLLGGGFENTRCYCIFGLQGEGKSITLLDIAMQIKKYNKGYTPKDKTKIPCVVYLTLENSKRETFTRYFAQLSDTGKQFTDYPMKEAIGKLNNLSRVDVNDPIDIVIKQEAADSIDTSYLYDLYDNLMDMGREPICFIVDYLNLVRSINKFSSSEERHKLGSVVKEFKTIAKDLDLPIITASQFNRGANSKVDEARGNSQMDLVKLLGRDNIGESMLILNNIDASFMIVPEMTMEDGCRVKYLGMKLAKARYEYKHLPGDTRQIHHPYTRFDGIKLVEDLYDKTGPKSKLQLMEENGMVKIDDIEDYDREDIIPVSKLYKNNVKETQKPKKKASVDGSVQQKPVVEYIDKKGIPTNYNPDWRNQPATINGNVNADSKTPEQQMRVRQLFNGGEKPISEFPISGGPSRYSDCYTELYDPGGDKVERILRDFSIEYPEYNFTEKDFFRLYAKARAERHGKKLTSACGLDCIFPVFHKLESPFCKNEDPYEVERFLSNSPVHKVLESIRSNQ